MTLVASSKLPRCLSCLRRSMQNDVPSLFGPVQVQVRGKKKLPRRTTVTVRLLENVKSYGSKGTILSVPPALMRNHFYPRSRAAYMTVAEIKHAEANELVEERDAGYGTRRSLEAKEKQQLVYEMQTITPQRARDLLDKTIPEIIEFQRKPIAQGTDAEPGAVIYGSVSSLDIMTDITVQLAKKALEQGFEDASKVVLSSHDIQVTTEGLDANIAEAERIKTLGEFDVTISVKNTDPILRKVKVVPLKADP